MPSLKGIGAYGPVRTVQFPWGDDTIVMRIRSSGVSAAEVVDADLTPTAETVSDAETMQRTVDSIAQSLAKCLVEWNVYLDEDETEEVRSYEEILLLPTEFLFDAFVALRNFAEADGSGEVSGHSAAG